MRKQIIGERYTTLVEGDFVIFLIGMRINEPWKVHEWWPVFRAMPKMLKEVAADPDSGFLGYRSAPGFFIQYWRSFEHLEAYARGKDGEHWPAWLDFNRRMRDNRADVGIWHETYLVRAGEYEAIASGMPPQGLFAIGETAPATGRHHSAADRLRAGSS
jgi:hypothetical protein